MKRNTYRRDLLKFHIPDDWTEVNGDEIGTYHDEVNSPGTVVVHTITLIGAERVTPKTIREVMGTLGPQSVDRRRLTLPQGYSCTHVSAYNCEEGVETIDDIWIVGQSDEGNTMHLVLVTYRVPVELSGSDLANTDLKVVQTMLDTLRIHPDL